MKFEPNIELDITWNCECHKEDHKSKCCKKCAIYGCFKAKETGKLSTKY